MLTTKNSAVPRSVRPISTAFTLLCALMLTACQPSGPKSLLLGDKYVRQGDYPRALKYLNRAAALIPEKPQVWNLLGLTYHGLQQAPQAAQAYQHALQIERQFAPAHYNLGVLLLEQQHAPEAINELGAYVGLAPGDVHGWEKLSTALIRARRVDDAEKAIQQALKLNPKSPEALNNQGLVHVLRKRPREGIQAFNAVLQVNPGFSAALLNQAIVAQQYFDNKELALERYRAFLTTKPDAKTAIQVRGLIDQLDEELHPAPQMSGPGPITNLPAAILQSNATRVAVAPAPAVTNKPLQTNLAAAVKTNSHVAIATNTGVAMTNTISVARTNLIASVPTNPPPLIPKADPVRETARTNSLPESQPEAVVPVEVVRVEKEPEFKAPSDLSQPVVASTNTSPLPGNNKAVGVVENPPLLIPRRERKDEDKPGLLDRMNPANWFKKDEKSAGATHELQVPPPRTHFPSVTGEQKMAKASPPPSPPPVFPRYPYRNNITLTPGNRAQAQKFFDLALAAHQRDSLREAIELYRKAIAADPSWFDAQYNLGLAAYQHKDLPLALAADEQAVTLKPGSVDARYNFAVGLEAANYYTDAANELRQVLAEAPNNVRAHLTLAGIYARHLDEPALARKHYQQVLMLSPNHPDAPVIRQWLSAQAP